jgi:hypothetical protein
MEVGSVHVQSAKSVTATNLVIGSFEKNSTGPVVAVVIDRTAARDSLKRHVYSQVVEGFARIGCHDEARADLLNLRSALVDHDIKSSALKREPRA